MQSTDGPVWTYVRSMTSSTSNPAVWKTDDPGKGAERPSEERTGYELMTGAVFGEHPIRRISWKKSGNYADIPPGLSVASEINGGFAYQHHITICPFRASWFFLHLARHFGATGFGIRQSPLATLLR